VLYGDEGDGWYPTSVIRDYAGMPFRLVWRYKRDRHVFAWIASRELTAKEERRAIKAALKEPMRQSYYQSPFSRS